MARNKGFGVLKQPLDAKEQRYLRLILVHILIGLVIYYLPPLRNPLYLIGIAYFFLSIIVAPQHKKTFQVLRVCCYIIGAEVLFRTTNGGLFYEASKYLTILFVIFGMFYSGIKGGSYPYFIYLILLVPAVIMASIHLDYDLNFRKSVAFVLSGPVCLGFCALYFYDKRITMKQMMEALLFMGLPIIAHTVYLYLYTPSVKEVLTSTASNFQTSGGFGPNQTASILGMGLFIFTARFFLNSPNLLLKLINGGLAGAIAFRAFVTFSRGGVVAAFMMIIAFMFLVFWQSSFKTRQRLIGALVLFSILGIVIWGISSNETGGLINKRYANENAKGEEKTDISTGRVELFVNEFEGFIKNPIFGVGASGMKQERLDEYGKVIASHNEVSRLFSEHGVFGLIILLILIFRPLYFRTTHKSNIFFFSFLIFWFATINHSAMRLAAPGFVYALALINIVHEKKRPVHRKLSEAS